MSADISFTANNFLSFNSINEAYDSSHNLQKLWNSLPNAVKTGDLDEQRKWEGEKKKLMSIVYKARLFRIGIFLSYTLMALGCAGVAVSQFYTSATFPVIGLTLTASGIVLHYLSKFYNCTRPKFCYCMHTHGVFIWGEVPHQNKLKKMVDKLAY